MGSVRALREAKRRVQDLVAEEVGPGAAADVLLFAYLDDVVLGVPQEACAAALQILHEELATIRHFPSWDKLEIWSPGGRPPPGLPEDLRPCWRAEGLTVLGLPLEAAETGGGGDEGGGGGGSGGSLCSVSLVAEAVGEQGI